MEKPKGIEIISGHTDVKESDKREGIAMYGSKPLGTKESSQIPTRSAEEIKRLIASLEEKWKSNNYVGDKKKIEQEIINLEKELSELETPSKELKTAKELAMEGKISWEKKNEDEKPENKETKDSIRKEIFETKEKIKELDDEKRKLDNEDEELKNELNKLEDKEIVQKDSVNPIDKKEVSAVETKKVAKEETKENKEGYSREDLLNAAEIFCKFNKAGYYKNPEGAKEAEENALKKLEAEHSEREITAAVNVARKRGEMANLKNEMARIKREYATAMDNPNVSSELAQKKYEQQITDIKTKIRLIDNDYNPLLLELKVSNLNNQLKNLEKYRDHADYKEKVQDAELRALSIMQTEIVRYQDTKISTNCAINPTGWDHVKNFFDRGIKGVGKNKAVQGYMKMGRGKRMALNAAVIGAGTALMLPATVAAGATAASFVAYKMARSLLGGTFGYFLSKKVFQPIVKHAYEHDSMKTAQAQQQEALNSKEMEHLQQLAKGEANPTEKEKILLEVARKNLDLCNKYADRIRRDKKYFAANNVLGTVAAGLIGGKAAQLTADWIAGPDGLGIFPGKPGIVEEPTPGDNNGGGGVIEIPTKPGVGVNPDDLKAATIGKGEGIEHALRRQLEMHPDKFGYKGDITDKAAIHKWSGTEADIIAHDQNYFAGDKETWVKDMGPKGPEGNPAYLLELDSSGKPSIHEYFEGNQSGTGGFNSPYEYGHESYHSALKTPDSTEHIIETNKGTENLDSNYTEYQDTSAGNSTDHFNNSNLRITEYEDNNSAINFKELQGKGYNSDSWNTAPENAYNIKYSQLQQVLEIQRNNSGVLSREIDKMFSSPSDRALNIEKVNTVLKREGLAKILIDHPASEDNEIFQPLHKLLDKAYNVTKVPPLETETAENYLYRSYMIASKAGKLNDLKL